MLVDIVMRDVQPLIETCFAEGWEAGIAMQELKATVKDYFGDFSRFLNVYFFKRLALKMMGRVRASAACTRPGLLRVSASRAMRNVA